MSSVPLPFHWNCQENTPPLDQTHRLTVFPMTLRLSTSGGKNDIAGEVVCNKIHKNQPHLGHQPWPAIFSIILHADILNIFHSIQTSDHPPNSPTFHVTHDRWFYFLFTEQNRSHHMDALPLPNTKHSSVPGSTPMLSSFFLTNRESVPFIRKPIFYTGALDPIPFFFSRNGRFPFSTFPLYWLLMPFFPKSTNKQTCLTSSWPVLSCIARTVEELFYPCSPSFDVP